jgi:hypothetical protein
MGWKVKKQPSPVVKEERYFAPTNDAQGGDPAGDQSSGDGGVAPKHKVPGKIAPESTFLAGAPASFCNNNFGRW